MVSIPFWSLKCDRVAAAAATARAKAEGTFTGDENAEKGTAVVAVDAAAADDDETRIEPPAPCHSQICRENCPIGEEEGEACSELIPVLHCRVVFQCGRE